jgi:hypothetical protein
MEKKGCVMATEFDRHHVGRSARQEHAGERDDEGRHGKRVDEKPHGRAEGRGDDEQQPEDSERMQARVAQEHGDEDAGKGDDGPDRQIDPTGQDHHRHPHRHDAEIGVVGQKIADHARRQHRRELQVADQVAARENADRRDAAGRGAD